MLNLIKNPKLTFSCIFKSMTIHLVFLFIIKFSGKVFKCSLSQIFMNILRIYGLRPSD